MKRRPKATGFCRRPSRRRRYRRICHRRQALIVAEGERSTTDLHSAARPERKTKSPASRPPPRVPRNQKDGPAAKVAPTQGSKDETPATVTADVASTRVIIGPTVGDIYARARSRWRRSGARGARIPTTHAFPSSPRPGAGVLAVSAASVSWSAVRPFTTSA
jgi:hypothetical protein